MTLMSPATACLIFDDKDCPQQPQYTSLCCLQNPHYKTDMAALA